MGASPFASSATGGTQHFLIDMPSLTQTEIPPPITQHQTMPREKTAAKKPPIRAYLMDMWSFIPYYIGELCAALREQSVDATLGSVRYHLDRNYFRKCGLIPDRFLFDAGGALRSGRARRIFKSAEYLFNLLTLALRFSISKPDILHVQYLPFLERGFAFEIWFLRWVRLLGIGVVCTVHNLTRQDAPDRNLPLYRRVYRLADALICHGEEARVRLMREFDISRDRISVIPHGPLFDGKPAKSASEARAAVGLPSTGPVVLCLGVISEYKGIPFLLDAWKRFTDSGGSGRLLIAGTGNARVLAEIREKAAPQPSVELRLEFIPVEQLPLLCQSADILVYPYKAGTTSGALLTGLNYGKAIVATTLPFFREYLRDEETALLVEYGDVSALASALLELIGHPEKRERLAAALQRESPRTVSWKEIAAKTRACYENVLKNQD